MQLGQRQPDGRPLRDHLLAALHNSGYVHPLLVPELLPPGGQELFELTLELGDARRQGMGSVSGILPTELEAWQRNHRVRLTPWELDTISAIDGAMRSIAADRDAKDKARRKAAPAAAGAGRPPRGRR